LERGFKKYHIVPKTIADKINITAIILGGVQNIFVIEKATRAVA
jgi:hypothetical protein